MPTSTTVEYRFNIATGATASTPPASEIAVRAGRYNIITGAVASIGAPITLRAAPPRKAIVSGASAAVSDHIPRIRSGYINVLKDGTRLLRVNADGTLTEVIDPQNTLVSAG
jgi:hypothetical protein